MLAAVTLVAGFALGFGICRWLGGDPEPAPDPKAALLRKYTERYDLTRDQQRLVWMILSKQRREEDEYLELQVEEARNEARTRETFAMIGRRAGDRILAILEPEQRERWRADDIDHVSTDPPK